MWKSCCPARDTSCFAGLSKFLLDTSACSFRSHLVFVSFFLHGVFLCINYQVMYILSRFLQHLKGKGGVFNL
jgi:hypothetical protein